MKTIQALLLLVLAFGAVSAVMGQEYLPEEPADTMALPSELFTAEELDDLLAPIALYPDPLLAQVLPAATFVEQIDAAARYVRAYGQAGVDVQPWDVSVRSVAHYPDVLFMMDQKYDWTASLGQAYLNQPQDVMEAIQRLRAEARDEGSLVSTPQQQVIVDEDGYIRIEPAEPEVIYVPSYDPLAVYVEPPPPGGFISFSIGFTIGAWLNRDCDWHRHRIYYHGWRGGGWIGRARPHVNRRSVYINNTYSTITVNRRVMQHDTVRFRSDIRRGAEIRRERRVTPPAVQPTRTPRVQPSPAVSAPRPAPPPAATAPRPVARPENTEFYRGREPRGSQPAARTGYGGYGSAGEAQKYHERGESSRQDMRQYGRPQQAPAARPASPAPAVRQPAPAVRQTAPAPPAGRGGGVRQR